MFKVGFLKLFFRNFQLLFQRAVRLSFRRKSRIRIQHLQANIHPNTSQYTSKFEIELQVKNAIAIKINNLYLPVFDDLTKLKFAYFLWPGTTKVKVRIIGFFTYKSISIPVNYNAPKFNLPSFNEIKRIKYTQIEPLSIIKSLPFFFLKEEELLVVKNTPDLNLKLNELKIPNFLNVELNMIVDEELNKEINQI